MSDYLPEAEAQYNDWLANFVAYVNNYTAELGLEAEMIAPVNTAHTTWSTAYAAHNTAALAARVARHTKDDAYDSSRSAVRVLVRRIQGNPNVTDAQKEAMGIRKPYTGTSGSGLGVTRPLGRVDITQRLQHTVEFVDEADPGSRARPKGVFGCEIRVKIGDIPPADPSETQMVGVAAKAPYIVQYNGSDAGKTAHYMMRWIDSKGVPGPWSETVSATIAA